MNIHLHIERIVLDSVPPGAGQQARLQAAIASELARLLVAGGLAPELLVGTALAHVAGTAPQGTEIGTSVAAGIYGGIGTARP